MMRSAILVLLFAALMICLTTRPVFAVNPDEILADQMLEERARKLSKGLRCVVCRNQSIDDSNAGIARDMRIVLRERLVSGDSDAEATQYLVDRYGDFVLLNPPFNSATYFLWSAPVFMFLITVWGFSRLWRRHSQDVAVEPPISTEDRAMISRILQQQDEQK